jgi:hypothetical protein
MIAHVIIKNLERVDMMTQAEAASQDISAIMQLNQQGELDAHTCTIDLMSIGSLWHTINGANSPKAKQTSKSALKSPCDGYYNYRRFVMQPLPGSHPEAMEKRGHDWRVNESSSSGFLFAT